MITRVADILPGMIATFAGASFLIVSESRLYPKTAIFDDARHDIYGVDYAPLRLKRGRPDFDGAKQSARPHAIQCSKTAGSEFVGEGLVIEPYDAEKHRP